MPCHHIGNAIICTRERTRYCVGCGRGIGAYTNAPVFLCDAKLKPDGKRKRLTCNKPVCASCRTNVADGKDLCPKHAAMWRKHPKNPENATA